MRAIAACAVLLAALVVRPALAAPIFEAAAGDVVVTLTNEPCKLTAVSNLPLRATWREAGKTHQGCFGAVGGVVLGYWSDRTVTALPASVFKPVGTGI